MGYIILGIIGFIILSFMLVSLVRYFPKLAYFIYRFSGFLCLVMLFGIAYKFYSASSSQKTVLIGSFAYPFMILYFVWLAKIANRIRQSQSNRWWVLFLKFQFGFLRLVFPPLGFLASACQTWFHEEKIQCGKIVN